MGIIKTRKWKCQ